MVRHTDTASSTTPTDSSFTCLVCCSFGSLQAMDELEVLVMDRVADLIDDGWAPEELVDEVDLLARPGSCAGQIVTLALVSHAGYWMSTRSMFGLLDQVDELAAGFHHLVGLTIPGWLDRYAHEDVETGSAVDGVVDALDALDDLSRRPHRMEPPPPGEDGSAWATWRLHRL